MTRKEAYKLIERESQKLPKAKYVYNVYGLVPLNPEFPKENLVRMLIGTADGDVNHKRRMKRSFIRSLHVTNPKLKTSKRQARLQK